MATNNADNISSSGFVAYDGAGTFSGRTLSPGVQNTIAITNGTGTAGNPTFEVTVNNLTNIPNSALANDSITINTSGTLTGGGTVVLGGSLSISDDLSGFVPYTGATASVDLGTHDLSAKDVNVTNPITVPNGGTGIGTLTSHAVLLGQGTSNISATAAGSAGQVLQSGGASADPTYSTATFPSTATGTGKVLIADGTNWVASTPTYPNASATSGKILISDGTNFVSSTPTYPNAASTALKHIKSDGTNFVTTTVTYPDASVTAGKVIVSDGTNYIASTPTFPNASATSGKFIRSDGTNWIASTPTLPTSAGTSGKVLQSDGTNYIESTPTYPSASGTSRKIIVSDGTNNVYSTETWAVPGTSGNVLTSDGTNWTSAAPSSGSIVITGSLTNAQIKALHATPVQLVAAPGAGKFIKIVACCGRLVYGGTNAFTAAASQTIALWYGTTSSGNVNILGNANITATSNQTCSFVPTSINGSSTLYDNLALNIWNSVATEITGNAANNNTVQYAVEYYIM